MENRVYSTAHSTINCCTLNLKTLWTTGAYRAWGQGNGERVLPAIDGHSQGVPLLGCLLMLLYLIFIWLMEIQQWKQIFLTRGKTLKSVFRFSSNFQSFLEIFSNFVESYSNFSALSKLLLNFSNIL